MKTKFLFLAALVLSAFMTGCASGPSFAEAKATIPSLNPEMGRLYIYRPSTFGAAVRPDVTVNGTVAGQAISKGFFYYDGAPGRYVISTETEVTRNLSLLLVKGQERYVRLSASMGFVVAHVYPELVDDATGAQEIQTCKYTGGEK